MTGTVDHTEYPPSSILSTPDIIQLLLKSCDKIAYENVKLERDHTNTKIEHVFKSMAEQISSQNSRMNDLQLQLETTNKYHEELLISLKRGLQDTFFEIGHDIKRLAAKISNDTCEETFSTPQQLKVHNRRTHEDQTPNTDSFILQVDGNDSDFMFSESDEEHETQPNQRQLNVINSTSAIIPLPPQEPSATHRNASFTLNKARQVKGLGVDANLEDFTVTVNDNNKNVIIQCSTAMYEAVAKPIFSNFSQGSSLMCNNFSLTCSHVDHNRDKTGVEYNRVLHVILGGSGQFTIGKVTVHLHHTKRSIQMQGSAIMPDGNRTPTWFLTHFLRNKLVTLAKEKHFDITVMNNAVKEAVENSASENIADICQHCARNFDTKSKPTKCRHCHRYFHKTSCLPVHSTSCSKKQNLAPGESSSLSSNSAPSSRSSLPPAQKRKRTDTHCPQPPPPPPDPCPTSPPRPAPEQLRALDHRQHHQTISPSQPHPVHPPAIHTTLPPPHNSPPPSAFPSSLPNNSNSPLNALAVPFNPGFSSNKRKKK